MSCELLAKTATGLVKKSAKNTTKFVINQRILQNEDKLGTVTVQKCTGSFKLVAVVYDFVHEAPRSDENGCC